MEDRVDIVHVDTDNKDDNDENNEANKIDTTGENDKVGYNH